MIVISNTQKEYILESERNLSSTEQTIFQIKPLSAKQYSIVSDIMRITSNENGKTDIQNSGKYTYETLKCGLVGWSNMKNESGNEIQFNKKDLDSNLDLLPIAIRYELSTAILELSMLKEDERKN